MIYWRLSLGVSDMFFQGSDHQMYLTLFDFTLRVLCHFWLLVWIPHLGMPEDPSQYSSCFHEARTVVRGGGSAPVCEHSKICLGQGQPTPACRAKHRPVLFLQIWFNEHTATLIHLHVVNGGVGDIIVCKGENIYYPALHRQSLHTSGLL